MLVRRSDCVVGSTIVCFNDPCAGLGRQSKLGPETQGDPYARDNRATLEDLEKKNSDLKKENQSLMNRKLPNNGGSQLRRGGSVSNRGTRYLEISTDEYNFL